MELLDLSPLTLEENLALDETLLLLAGQGEGQEVVRFWEAENYSVVAGVISSTEEEIKLAECKQDKIKILRRSSGGATVLQGKGCLNYSLLLSYTHSSQFRNIRSSYKLILTKLAERLSQPGLEIEFYPLSDLALNRQKISGNAQVRKKNFFLHHGTILYDFDIPLVSRYLKIPRQEPAYRKGRNHLQFLTNLPLPRKEIKIILVTLLAELSGLQLQSRNYLTSPEQELMYKLLKEKYANPDWIFRR